MYLAILYIPFIYDIFYKFVEMANQGTRSKRESERHCVLPVVRTDDLDSLSKERRNRERARIERKREGRVWYALRAAGSHTTGPKERTPGPRRFLHHARRPPRVDAEVLQSKEASSK